jgi:heme/copper-type cytochrome/quinol oxidase subunit 1
MSLAFFGCIFRLSNEIDNIKSFEDLGKLFFYIGGILMFFFAAVIPLASLSGQIRKSVDKDPDAKEFNGTIINMRFYSQVLKTITYIATIAIDGGYQATTYIKNPACVVGSRVIVRFNPTKPKYCKFIIGCDLKDNIK